MNSAGNAGMWVEGTVGSDLLKTESDGSVRFSMYLVNKEGKQQNWTRGSFIELKR